MDVSGSLMNSAILGHLLLLLFHSSCDGHWGPTFDWGPVVDDRAKELACFSCILLSILHLRTFGRNIELASMQSWLHGPALPFTNGVKGCSASRETAIQGSSSFSWTTAGAMGLALSAISVPRQGRGLGISTTEPEDTRENRKVAKNLKLIKIVHFCNRDNHT